MVSITYWESDDTYSVVIIDKDGEPLFEGHGYSSEEEIKTYLAKLKNAL